MDHSDSEQSGERPARIDALRGDFVWGVSTSSFQIEGATRIDGRGPSVWDTDGARGILEGKDTGDVACDHYHRYGEDIALMQRLGVQAYRFSVAWPRVLPQGRGAANEAGLAFYDRLIDGLLEAGIEPWLCLYHWDLPQALDAQGGWTNRDSVGWFSDYASLVGQRYGDRVRRFATFNEPAIFTLFGYGFGHGNREDTTIEEFHRGIHHINLSHGAAVAVLRAAVRGASLGSIHNVQPCRPSAPEDGDGARWADTYWNRAYPDPQCLGRYPDLLAPAMERILRQGDMEQIRQKLDWFGLNHYSPNYVRNDAAARFRFNFGDRPPGIPGTPMGWPIEPDGFRESLHRVAKDYGLPVYVTENGFGGHDREDESGAVADPARIAYLKAYIEAMNRAAAEGADIRGYFVWSLLDNFEWDTGYEARFGLVHIDYATCARKPKASFDWYRRVIRAPLVI
ncbi:MAG: GH1 family beta-glucosidase [Alphaproteobacteria bacterium]|nr:GH1 family beta-glucosidase [Alphaproteobacteria bacterium]